MKLEVNTVNSVQFGERQRKVGRSARAAESSFRGSSRAEITTDNRVYGSREGSRSTGTIHYSCARGPDKGIHGTIPNSAEKNLWALAGCVSTNFQDIVSARSRANFVFLEEHLETLGTRESRHEFNHFSLKPVHPGTDYLQSGLQRICTRIKPDTMGGRLENIETLRGYRENKDVHWNLSKRMIFLCIPTALYVENVFSKLEAWIQKVLKDINYCCRNCDSANKKLRILSVVYFLQKDSKRKSVLGSYH